MNKDNILFGIVGLLLGCIIGFVFANKVNQNGLPSRNAGPSQSVSSNPNMPADHPPLSGDGTDGNMPEVTETINKAKDEPNNFEAQMQAAALYYKIGRLEQALELFQKANKIKPDDYQAIVWLGNVNFDLDRYETAETWYTAALVKKPDDVSIRTDLGLTFMFRQPPDLDRAIKEFQGSLQRDANHKQTLQNITSAYIQKGDAQKAKEYLVRLEKVEPTNEEIAKLKKKIENIRPKS
jgi:tetratricopeptide (TPR) repeat protein